MESEVIETQTKPSSTSRKSRSSSAKKANRSEKHGKGQSPHKNKHKDIEYFQPIVRKNQQLQRGNGIKSYIFKKIAGTKEKYVGAEDNDYDNFGRRIFYGNVKKKRGNLQASMHSRWVVMRGWQLYWYREPGDLQQKGILTLPSQEVRVPPDKTLDKKTCFALPKEEAKDGNIASRQMSFGDDFNTKVFRNFVSFMIKYKMYAEFVQRYNYDDERKQKNNNQNN